MYMLIGAGGFIGFALANYLSEKSLPYITVSRSFQWSNRPFETRYICSASSLFSGDISFPSEISIIYMAGSPNLLAAEADPFFDFKSHFDELSTFLEGVSLLRCSLKFFFLSSGGAVYGDSNGVPKAESSPLSPKSVYGRRNVLLETLVKSFSTTFSIDSTILRVTNPFGPGQSLFRRKGLIQALIDSSASGETVFVRGDGFQERDYIYTSHLSSLLFSVIDAQSYSSVLNIASGYSYSARDIVHFLKSHGLQPRVEYLKESREFEVNDSIVLPDAALRVAGLAKSDISPLTSANLDEIINTSLEFL